MAKRSGKRKGGRGHKAPYDSTVIRCPDPILAEVRALIDLYDESDYSDYPTPRLDKLRVDIDQIDKVMLLFSFLRVVIYGCESDDETLDPPRRLPVDIPLAKGSEGQGSERSGEAKPLPLTLRFIRDLLSKGRGRGVGRSVAFRLPLQLVFNSRNP